MKKEQPEPVTNSQILNGVSTAICWIVGHVFYYIAITFLCVIGLVGYGSSLSGTCSGETVIVLAFGILIGVVVSGLAGFPAGFAVMLPHGKRKPMFKWFAGMFAAGVMIQIWSFVCFFVN